MIGLISGTSEGKELLSNLNRYTDNILVSTATSYGGELLKDYKYKYLNTTPLDKENMIKLFKEKKVEVLIDASHPYALEVSKNAMEVCNCIGIEYIRFEREKIIEKFLGEEKILVVENYEDLYSKLKYIKGNILNTTGSRNMDKIIKLNLENRIIHRVLPSLKVIKECFDLGVELHNIIAIKGPITYDLNRAFIREYNAKAILLKDSGKEGGTEEKIRAAIDENIYAIVVDRKSLDYKNKFNNKEEVIKYLKKLQYI
ncbi:cobalt-precorrin-6A reductase [Clostridium cochlearium]|jgi:precorrin-6A/cobalt-precorrin-6A reductase|uniref:Cobalt-precorrin-6x reductase n=1 Tax=Clostridium cochlearium TaxID=1494 RepID=A0A239ZHP1_CLOCO|nr:cobalt-precorrin-6A reductase [Clostridium cochlearium]MBE6063905.1 cobalt-precorrin-6A reductase [Clostridium cochlearium]MBU5269136.1 cobalt-precorrin-6A reductase [Clostridium cochlearium]MCR1971427.1 cobalt-precorrin-6A reductase [Clostridium cochlearium]NMA58766.1 cobalt-precorrin-6A reductase [Clostridium cochlearium]SNV70655.1 cobalt-precorrin-6x reductase [Clostridium cochlearium]